MFRLSPLNNLLIFWTVSQILLNTLPPPVLNSFHSYIFRAEKTEVLSSDLQNAEKRLDTLKSVLQSAIKKISSSLQALNISDQEKRLVSAPFQMLRK